MQIIKIYKSIEFSFMVKCCHWKILLQTNNKKLVSSYGMFNKHKNDNSTRRVKELVMGFETLGPGVNLEVKNTKNRV